jgi:hypothetical protein
MNEETNALITKFYLKQTSVRDFSDWAVSCLEKGLDTKSIRILASMFDAKSLSEIDTYFQRSLDELGWKFPEEKECLERNAKFIAQQILDKEISPKDGCRKIYEISTVLEQIAYPTRSINWSGLFWGYEDLPEDEMDKEVILEAGILINGEKIIYPKNIEERLFLSEPQKKENFFTKFWKKIP